MKKMKNYVLMAMALMTVSACASAPVQPLANRLVTAQSVTTPGNPGTPSNLSAPPVHLRIKQAEIEVSTQELNAQFKFILELSNEKRIREPILSTLAGSSMQLVGKVKPFSYSPEIPFSVKGDLVARPGNVIRFSPTDIRVVGIPFKGLMDILGIELSNLANFKDRWGRVVQSGNDIDLIIEKFTKDAIIEGQIKQVRTAPGGITVVF